MPVAFSVYEMVLHWHINAGQEVEKTNFNRVSFGDVAVVRVVHLHPCLGVQDDAVSHKFEQLKLYVQLVALVQAHAGVDRFDF